MAVWQWTLYLVPKNEVIKLFQTVPKFVDEEWFYENKWYQNCKPSVYETAFNLMLPREYDLRASSEVLSWGVNNDNEIYMCFQGEEVTELSFRINAKQVNMSFITSLVDFASENNFLFWTLENNTFIEPTLDTFLERFRQSRAMLFVQNQEGFFSDKNYLEGLQRKNLKKLESDDLF